MTRPTALSFEQRSTVLGCIAIIFWSTTIAFSRSLTELLGTFTAASMIYLAAGIMGVGYSALRPGWLSSIRSLPKIYILGCGGLFVLYIVCLYLAIGSASTRSDVLAVGLINYLWPGLSLVFSIPILGKRGNILLPIGILIALTGIWLATTSTQTISSGGFFRRPHHCLRPFCARSYLLGHFLCRAVFGRGRHRLAQAQRQHDGGRALWRRR